MSVRLLAEKCETCIFRPGNLMHLRDGRLREMVEQCHQQEGHVICHSYLLQPGGRLVAGPEATGAICRGWWDATDPRPDIYQLAERLGVVEEVAP